MDQPDQQAMMANMEVTASELPVATLERAAFDGAPQHAARSQEKLSEAEGRPGALGAARQELAREHAATERPSKQPWEAARDDSAAGPSMQPTRGHWQAPANDGPRVREMGAAAGQDAPVRLMNIQVRPK